MRLRVGRQHSQFWPILTRFVDYYSLFWGPGVISTINEPLSAFTCRSSIILGLSDSGLFHGLLLTVLGSQNTFHGCRTPRSAMCWSSTLVVWVGSGPFLGLYLVLGSRSDFHDCRTSGCVYVWSSTLSISANSGSFRALLLTVLGPRVISMIDDPRCAFTCPSSTLTVLANSVPFRGLLLTVLGSPSDFHSRSTPRCAYVSVVNTRSFG